MDATLLHIISRLLEADSHLLMQEDDLLELVRLLDMANIVTAYFEQGRREVLFDLLKLVQSRLGSHNDSNGDIEPTAKKQRRHGKSQARDIHEVQTLKSLLLPGIKAIKTYNVDDAPDMAELSTHTEPFIVKGAVADWPAISDPRHGWADCSYLLKVAGRGRIVPVEIGSSYTAEGWTQKMLGFEEFLQKIRWEQEPPPSATREEGQDDSKEPVLYLAQHDLFQQFPELLADIITPDYVWSEPGPPDHYPDYKPPVSAAGYTINAWMGPKDTYSPAHTDPYYNCYGE